MRAEAKVKEGRAAGRRGRRAGAGARGAAPTPTPPRASPAGALT